MKQINKNNISAGPSNENCCMLTIQNYSPIHVLLKALRKLHLWTGNARENENKLAVKDNKKKQHIRPEGPNNEKYQNFFSSSLRKNSS